MVLQQRDLDGYLQFSAPPFGAENIRPGIGEEGQKGLGQSRLRALLTKPARPEGKLETELTGHRKSAVVSGPANAR